MPVLELSGKTIKIGRAMKGWSQRELGKKAGLKMWRIWALENDVYGPRPDEVEKILQALSSE